MNQLYSRRSPQTGTCDGPRTSTASRSSRMYCCSFFQFSSRFASTCFMKSSRSDWTAGDGRAASTEALSAQTSAIAPRVFGTKSSVGRAWNECIRRRRRPVGCRECRCTVFPMHEMPLLMNFTIALAYALAGGLIARRVGLPAIVGYLIAGIALGPHTLGFRGDEAALGQLAEFGVILLMFDVGLHFSFRDLWHVRRI